MPVVPLVFRCGMLLPHILTVCQLTFLDRFKVMSLQNKGFFLGGGALKCLLLSFEGMLQQNVQ